MADYLTPILERKRVEVARRLRHAAAWSGGARPAQSERAGVALRERVGEPPRGSAAPDATGGELSRAALAEHALRRRTGEPPRVIAEIKRRSPSRGQLRERARGDVQAIARAYVAGGAAAVSVLCDGPGFGGSPLDLRRAARSVAVPLLFKEFVLDEIQIELARAVGAHMVLLLVRALPPERLHQLVAAASRAGLAAVVEAADARELAVALQTDATIVGVNARDLGSFQIDSGAAQRALVDIPAHRIAVHMSGVRTRADFQSIARGRADAVLIGESLMRAAAPDRLLADMLRG